MLAGSAVQLADLYDIASGLTATRDGNLRFPKAAMSIGGERGFGDLRGAAGVASQPHWASGTSVSASG